MVLTNRNEISLEMAVWLADDDYDHVDEPNYISATGLMKPLRQIILARRIPENLRIIPDVEDYIATSMGQALHAGIEKAWLNGRHRTNLRKLGYPDHVINRVLVNPTDEELAAADDPIVIYVEQRAFKKILGYTIGGKYDMVCEGRVTDTKSTSVYSWIYGGKDDDYRLQGSIYRWLNPDKITDDHIRINFIFTDWKKLDAQTKYGYPPRRVMHKDIPLMSIEETENWIRNKLRLIEKYKDADESEIPECTDEELWMSVPKYKYFSDPSKITGRATKNFDNPEEANEYMAAKGKGTIIVEPGSPKRCGYCPAFPICTQKDKYPHD